MGQLSRRRPTHDGHIVRATLPKECHPSLDPLVVVVVVVVVVRTDDLTRMFVHTRQQKRRKGGRTPGRQTPGVPATLGLNVQEDGGRKNARKTGENPYIAVTTCGEQQRCPLISARNCQELHLSVYLSLLRRRMSTNSGDELKLRHLHCQRRDLSLHNDRHTHHNLAKNWTCGASTGLFTVLTKLSCITTGMLTPLSPITS